MELYPLKERHPEYIKSRSGKGLEDVSLKAIMDGTIGPEDIKISREVLILQAEVARQAGRIQLAENFIRSAELIEVPDDEILKIYDHLRPYRCTYTELLKMAEDLRHRYSANLCADFIEETAKVYQTRDILKK